MCYHRAPAMLAADGFIYFVKGAFPCLFLIEVNEGVARFQVDNQESLDILLKYCRERRYGVNWARAVADEQRNRALYADYPGGKYVAAVSSAASAD